MVKKYRYNIGEEVNGLKIVKQTVNKHKQKTYEVQSLEYLNAPTYIIAEYSLINGYGDAYSSGIRVFEGNSIYSVEHLKEYIVNIEEAKTIHAGSRKTIELLCKECGFSKKTEARLARRNGFNCLCKKLEKSNLYDVVEIRRYIIDIEEAKHTNKSSDKEIKCKCDNCSNIKSIKPRNLIQSGFNCYYCSKNVSYPEQFMLAYLKMKNLDFEYQFVFNNAKNLRFDFVNLENKMIIEAHGSQHYDDNSIWYDRTHKSDVAKRKYCKENGYVLIELDCRESTFEFIKNSIEQCEYLPNIESNEHDRICSIISKNKKYDIKDIIEMYRQGESTENIGLKYNTDRTTIASILKKNDIETKKPGKYKRKLNYNPEEILNYHRKGYTVKEIVRVLGLKPYNIYNTLRNNNLKPNKRR